jgi:hypothetical protein
MRLLMLVTFAMCSSFISNNSNYLSASFCVCTLLLFASFATPSVICLALAHGLLSLLRTDIYFNGMYCNPDSVMREPTMLPTTTCKFHRQNSGSVISSILGSPDIAREIRFKC